MNKGMRSKHHHTQKMRFGIKKIHHYYATVINPGWKNLLELRMGIIERLTNKQLKYITESNDEYYFDIRELCLTEIMEREVFGKETIREDHEKVNEVYRKASKGSGLHFRKRR